MVFKPLGSSQGRHLGSATQTVTAGDDEVADLPGGVFFSAERTDEDAAALAGLYYKDGRGVVRRVRLAKTGEFQFVAVASSGNFRAVSDILFVPELDPLAWASATDVAKLPLADLSALARGSVFTALGATESLASERRGVYRVGRDGLFRRLLRDPAHGLHWSDPIPAGRFGHVGGRLGVD
jgi:hypothetical protein